MVRECLASSPTTIYVFDFLCPQVVPVRMKIDSFLIFLFTSWKTMVPILSVQVSPTAVYPDKSPYQETHLKLLHCEVCESTYDCRKLANLQLGCGWTFDMAAKPVRKRNHSVEPSGCEMAFK